MAVYNRLIRAAAFKIIDLRKPFFIGLTGPTGAGKGYVSSRLAEMGFNILDADKYVKKIYDNNPGILNRLAAEFGNDIIINGELDRKKLAQIAFSSKENTKRLNSIVHPEVISLCERDAKPLAVLDAPQLFEAGAADKCYKIISVIADYETRLRRITERDKITQEQAFSRMNAQFDESYYINNSDFVIYNNGEDIDSQIKKIMEEIL